MLARPYMYGLLVYEVCRNGVAIFPVTTGGDQSIPSITGHFFYISGPPQGNNINSLQKKTFTKSLGGHGPRGPPLATPLVCREDLECKLQMGRAKDCDTISSLCQRSIIDARFASEISPKIIFLQHSPYARIFQIEAATAL